MRICDTHTNYSEPRLSSMLNLQHKKLCVCGFSKMCEFSFETWKVLIQTPSYTSTTITVGQKVILMMYSSLDTSKFCIEIWAGIVNDWLV